MSQSASILAERLQLWARHGAASSTAGSASATASPADARGPSFESIQAGPASLRALVRRLADEDPDFAPWVRRHATGAQRGRVELLGHGAIDVAVPPRWHREGISGHVAPRVHWSRINYLDPSLVGDHKLLWELNRHQYLLASALAWLLDADAAHVATVEQHVASWLDENPPKVGVNWASSLEVAYRAIAWCWLLWLLRDSPLSPGIRARMATSLEAHALHVERYLSYYFSPNTHLTGEALGLFVVGTALPQWRHSARVRALGANILDAAIARQVYSDGVYFEQAMQYQRYTADIYLQYVCLARSSGWQVPGFVRDRLLRALEYLRTVAAGDGRVPLIGDDDGGLLLPVDSLEPDQVSGVLLAGAVEFGREDLRLPQSRHPALAYLLCGMSRTDNLLVGAASQPGWGTTLFPLGGTCVMRDGWQPSADVAVIDVGRHGVMNCGHSHADALSLCLSRGGTPLFIDRGTLTYVGDERDEFRSTRSHNTLEIDGESSIATAGPFQWRRAPGPPTADLGRYGDWSVLDCSSDGHVETARRSVHRRVVVHCPASAWVIYDQGFRDGAGGAVARWQLHPDLSVERAGDRLVTIRDAAGAVIAHVAAPLVEAIGITTRDVSPRFGARLPATVLEFPAAKGLDVLTVVLPPNVDVAVEPGGVIHWSDSAGSHVLGGPSADGIDISGWQSDARLLWVTWPAPAGPGAAECVDSVIAVHASRLRSDDDCELGSPRAGADRGIIAARRGPDGWAPLRRLSFPTASE